MTDTPRSVTVYTSPTCPYCTQVKEYLSSRGVRFAERNVTADREAAAEMIRVSQQRGVPVIVVDGEVVVGFNRPQLERILGAVARPRLGAAVADAALMAERGLTAQRSGAYVGSVTPGGVADQAGLHPQDVIVAFAGHAVGSAAHLQQLLAGAQAGQAIPVEFVRAERTLKTILTL